MSNNTINVFNETKEDLNIEKIISNANKVLDYENTKSCELNIIMIDNEQIKKINKEYRSIDQATDVLAFPLGFSTHQNHDMIKERYRLLGEVYISIEKANEQALEFNHSLDKELEFLVVHGVLHLLGYDHIKLDDEKIMRRIEEEIING